MMSFLKSGSGHSMARLLMLLIVVTVCYAVARGIDVSASMATVVTSIVGTLGAVWTVAKWRRDGNPTA